MTDALTLMRQPGQWSELYLAMLNPASVFAARVNQEDWDDKDQVIEVPYDGGSGAYADILPGMTLWVGSSAGAYDKGRARIRKAATATSLYIGAESDIDWEDNLYLTVVDSLELWMKRSITLKNGDYLVDEEIEYSDQHDACDPVVVMGGPRALWIEEGATEVVTTMDGSDSWVLGSAISGYSWSCTGGLVEDEDTATPSLTFDAAGTYRVSCTVTAANGKSATGHRYIFVFDITNRPVRSFQLESCGGNYEEGGWQFGIRMWDEAGLSAVWDGALVVLFARDHYGDYDESAGPVAGQENVIAWGWIDGESIDWDPEVSEVSFTVLGPAGVMQKIPGQPVFVKDTSGEAAERWTQFNGLTLDAFMWHTLHWRSTATAVMDCYPSGDTRKAGEFSTEADALWEKMLNVCQHRMATRPWCDRYGRMHWGVDTQLTPVAERASIPTVMAITKVDWQEAISIERSPIAKVGKVELSGVYYESITNWKPYSAWAAGTALKRFGLMETRDNLMLSSQAQANELAGMMLGQRNNPYPSVNITLGANNRLVEINPRQRVTLSLEAVDTPRGITWTDQKLLVRRVELRHDPESGFLWTEIECEAETLPELAIAYIPPSIPITNKWTPPDLPNIPPVGLIPGPHNPPGYIPPPLPPTLPADCPVDAPANGPYFIYYGGLVEEYTPFQYTIFDCLLRSSAHDNLTRYTINGRFQWYNPSGGWEDTDDDLYYELTAYDNANNLLATGIHDALSSAKRSQRTGYFSLPASAAAHSFRLNISGATIPVDSADGDVGDGEGAEGAWDAGWSLTWSVDESGAIKGEFHGHWAGRQSSPGFHQIFYPTAPHIWTLKPFHVSGDWITNQDTSPSGILSHKEILNWNGSTLWQYLMQQTPGLNVTHIDRDFTNLNVNNQLGLNFSFHEDHPYFGEGSFGFYCACYYVWHPLPSYRILLNNVQMWNVCR
jgi:hypothetical protein